MVIRHLGRDIVVERHDRMKLLSSRQPKAEQGNSARAQGTRDPKARPP